MSRKSTPPTSTHTLRIIGGRWRGRRFAFPLEPGLRPTLDRFRETLFNWLMYKVPGAHCLDAFAGSGALGLEALSRGAASVTLIDNNVRAMRELANVCQTLRAEHAHLVQTDCLQWLRQPAQQQFDIVFLDPPFAAALLEPVCTLLETGGWLADDAWIYCEFGPATPEPAFPEHWHLYREKCTKTKNFFLFKRQSSVQ